MGLNPASRAIIGSQQVPFIYEDRVSKESFVEALLKLFNMPVEERRNLGTLGREHLLNNYNSIVHLPKWDTILTKMYDELGSWENRKKYKTYSVEEI